ncbi:MAG: diacylglycerol kinase family lipid kinase [Saprospiraceae bacterium]|nr:diacylglycerol kinase family lipid kinase [Saprospiraceae bacterium]
MSKKVKDHWFIIVNPKANGGRLEKEWEHIKQCLNYNHINLFIKKTTHPNHATELTKDAIENGYKKIIAVGGDGTGNEVANGILQQKIIPSSDITFALLPVGTGNDWIKTHKIPKHLETWIKMLKNEKTTFQDVGLVQCFLNQKKIERYFINVAGMAYDAFGVQLSEGKNWHFPKIQYLFHALSGLFKYKIHRAKLIFDEQKIIDYFYIINVGICKYSGGGMQLVPHAVPNDGNFALTFVRKISKLDVILNSYRFYNSSLLEHSKVEGSLTKKIRVETMDDEPTGVEVDGEYIGESPVEFSILPKALKIIIK